MKLLEVPDSEAIEDMKDSKTASASTSLNTDKIIENPGDVITTTLDAGLPKSFRGNTSLLLLYDHYSNFVWVEPLTSKPELDAAILRSISWVESYSGNNIKMVCSNKFGWLGSKVMNEHLRKADIIHHKTTAAVQLASGSPQVTFRDLYEFICRLLEQTNLPILFWDFCAEYAAYQLNTSVKHTVIKTKSEMFPLEAMSGLPPQPKTTNKFGCDSLVYVRCSLHGVDLERGLEAVYLGPTAISPNERFYIMKNRTIVTSDNYQTFPWRFENAKKISGGRNVTKDKNWHYIANRCK